MSETNEVETQPRYVEMATIAIRMHRHAGDYYREAIEFKKQKKMRWYHRKMEAFYSAISEAIYDIRYARDCRDIDKQKNEGSYGE